MGETVCFLIAVFGGTAPINQSLIILSISGSHLQNMLKLYIVTPEWDDTFWPFHLAP